MSPRCARLPPTSPWWFFIFCFCLLSCAAETQSRKVVAIAHRGEHLIHPENTIPAFEEAIRLGADFIEVDVRTTADGKLVLSHDGKVDRRTNGKGEVSKMTFEEIRVLDAGIKSGPKFAGTKIPTFDEALELARGKIGIYVDVKQASARDIVSHIERHAMTEQVVIYAGLALSKEIQALNPKLKVLPESENVETLKRLIKELRPKVIAFSAHDWKPEIIRLAKEALAEVYVDRMGSTDSPAGWQAAIDDGADGIQTDRPAELVQFLREKGYKKR